MGCATSKLDNDDMVRQCRERCRLMKEAVYARHHLAVAQSDYSRYLRLTGIALCSFANEEPLHVLDTTPPIFLRTPSTKNPDQRPFNIPHSKFSESNLRSLSPESQFSSASSRNPNQGHVNVPHSKFSESNLRSSPESQFSRDSSTIKIPNPIASSRRHRRPVIRVPHILSESSPPSSPDSGFSTATGQNNNPYTAVPNFAYSSTPASSVWNWENFRPPSPPDSETFNRRLQNHTIEHELHYDDKFEHNTKKISPTSSDFLGRHEGNNFAGNRDEMEREEVQYSEWEDHYSDTITSSDNEADHVDDCKSKIETQSNSGSSQWNQEVATPAPNNPPAPCNDHGESSTSWKANAPRDMLDGEIVVSYIDLKGIVDAIKVQFDKAAHGGEQLSQMLEAGRAQLDRNFRQLKKTVYHSNNLFSNISATWTSKPPLAVKYLLDTSSLVESGSSKSLCSMLERLLAWEKKLYEEVKAREGAKIKHNMKLSTLQSQECKGERETRLDKTKASIESLQSIIIVTSQAVSTTSNAINDLKDRDLIPQLFSLCEGLTAMWSLMNECHDVQSRIVHQVQYLVNRHTNLESTTNSHRQATHELETSVSAWHSSFTRLIKYHRDFNRSLHSWFKLTLIPLQNPIPKTPSLSPSRVLAFFDDWKLALDRIPDTVASESIKSFVSVVHAISVKQSEETKIGKRVENASRELERKAMGIRNLERKFYQSYSVVGLGVNERGLDEHDPLADKKIEMESLRRKVEDERLRYVKAIEATRAMTLNNIQTGLPGVFQAMTSFSAIFAEAMEAVCSHSRDAHT